MFEDSSPPERFPALSPAPIPEIFEKYCLDLNHCKLVSYLIQVQNNELPGDEVAERVVEPDEELPASSFRLSGLGGGVSA